MPYSWTSSTRARATTTHEGGEEGQGAGGEVRRHHEPGGGGRIVRTESANLSISETSEDLNTKAVCEGFESYSQHIQSTNVMRARASTCDHRLAIIEGLATTGNDPLE